jgi:protein arginine kinase activator
VKCQLCNENKATIHLTEIEKGEQKELHLCEACAIKKGVVTKPITLKEFLGKIAEQTSSPEESKIRCPDCGSNFQDFSSTGRLGCAGDYEVFSAQLLPILEKMHGGEVQHAGKIPTGAGEQVAMDKEIRQMRLELERLIREENYEGAAAVRDKIRELENRNESGKHSP